KFQVVLARGTPVRYARTVTFGTGADDQKEIRLHILRGRSGTLTENHSLGWVRVPDLPPGPRRSTRVAVTFQVVDRAIVLVGHNAAFDWSYISYYFTLFKIPNPFGYKALDIKSLAMGRLRIGWFETSKENLEALLPSVPRQDLKQAHRADYDALYQAHILCA